MKQSALASASIALLCAGLAATVSAEPFYVGVSAGQTRGEVDSGRINNELVNKLGYFTADTQSDTTDSGVRAFAGYQFHPNLAVEASYTDLGKVKWNSSVTPTGTLSTSIRSRAYGLALVASYPMTSQFSAYLRAGVSHAESEASLASSGFVDLNRDNFKKSSTDGAYALGAQFNVNPKFAVRVEYETYRNLGSDEMGGKYQASLTSVGVLFKF